MFSSAGVSVVIHAIYLHIHTCIYSYMFTHAHASHSYFQDDGRRVNRERTRGWRSARVRDPMFRHSLGRRPFPLIPSIRDKRPPQSRGTIALPFRAGNEFARIARIVRALAGETLAFSARRTYARKRPAEIESGKLWRRQEIYGSPFSRFRALQMVRKASPRLLPRDRDVSLNVCARFSSMKI